MKIALSCSSKDGLLREYARCHHGQDNLSTDCFAEGDTQETIDAVREAIASFGHEVFVAEADAGLEAELLRIRPDLVFNLAEGLFGYSRESYVPMLCEKLSLPCTGSDSLATGICLHKGRCKEILLANRIATPSFRFFRPGNRISFAEFSFPGIVKPVAEGSSKGVFDTSVVENASEAEAVIQKCFAEYAEPVIVEEFLPGDEFTAAMFGNGNSLEILPLIALNFNQLPKGAKKIYSYEAKWIWDKPHAPLKIFQCPAVISDELRDRIEILIRNTFRVLELRDWCRMDIRLDADGAPNIIEVNPIPGILPNPDDNSCFPKAARSAGYEYRQIFGKVIDAAMKRLGGH